MVALRATTLTTKSCGIAKLPRVCVAAWVQVGSRRDLPMMVYKVVGPLVYEVHPKGSGISRYTRPSEGAQAQGTSGTSFIRGCQYPGLRCWPAGGSRNEPLRGGSCACEAGLKTPQCGAYGASPSYKSHQALWRGFHRYIYDDCKLRLCQSPYGPLCHVRFLYQRFPPVTLLAQFESYAFETTFWFYATVCA